MELINSFSMRSMTNRFKNYVSFIGIINLIQSVIMLWTKK